MVCVTQAIVGDDDTINADNSVDQSNEIHDTNGTVTSCMRVLCSCKTCAFVIGTCHHLETLSNSQAGISDGTKVVISVIANGVKVKIFINASVTTGDPSSTKRGTA